MALGIYSLLLALSLGLSAPWWLWRMARDARYREGLAGRLGLVPDALTRVAAGQQVIWLHAVSVGEVLAAESLLSELQQALPGWIVVVSTTTAPGQKIARERFGTDHVFFYPLDFRFAVRPYLHALRPKLFVLMESELWPRMLRECAHAGIPIAVANARISDRSFPRYMRLRGLWRPLLQKVSLFLAQSEESAGRLRRIGAPRVLVTGNLKYDAAAPDPTPLFLRMRALLADKQLVIAGSTLPGEEEMVLTAWAEVLVAKPDTVLMLAPRHPQRFGEVETLLLQSVHTVVRATASEAQHAPLGGGAIILLDTLGELAGIYELASAALIGGSLVPRGGHNPLEPARFGVPVVMGQSYENFREIVDGMRAANALQLVGDSAALAAALIQSLSDDGGMGERGRTFFESNRGATRRTVDALIATLRATLEERAQ